MAISVTAYLIDKSLKIIKMKQFTFLIALVALTLAGCAEQPGVKRVNVPEAQQLMAQKKDLQIVDLRTPGELAATGRIEGSVNINFTGDSFAQQTAKLDKNKPLLIYCAAGSRSAQAAEILGKEGFKELYDLSPGMNGWLYAKQKTVPQ